MMYLFFVMSSFPQRHFLFGLWSISLGLYLWWCTGSRHNGRHCCCRPGGSWCQCVWLYQTTVQRQHPLDQRGWKTQNGPKDFCAIQTVRIKKIVAMILFPSCFCVGCGIPGPYPLLWPKRKSQHCIGNKPGCCRGEGFSKRGNDFIFTTECMIISFQWLINSVLCCLCCSGSCGY